MSEAAVEKPRTPGFIIFVAILNFISASMWTLGIAVSVLIMAFGNAWGVYDLVNKEWTRMSAAGQSSVLGPLVPPAPENLSYGLNFLFGVILLLSVVATLFFIWVGLGLLKGKRSAWYSQITMSVMGLVAFPVGTLLNAVILVIFFQHPTRDHFTV